MTFDYLTAEDIINLHELGLERYGGKPGLDENEGYACVDAKSYLPQQSFAGIEKYKTLTEKAAAYMYFISIGHCFVDGNKRTGYLAASTFLNLNGYIISVSDKELYDMCIKIANDKTRPPIEELIEWLQKHIILEED